MREASNCLNAGLVLLTLPLYLLAPLAAVGGMMLDRLAPGWLPERFHFVATNTFLVIAFGMVWWYVVVSMIVGGRQGNTMDFCGIEAAFAIFEDGLSGYLLLAGVIAAVIALKLAGVL